MTEENKIKTENGAQDSPLVFISHDSRDADLAEAFSKLLKSISAGMLKSFYSSAKKGSEGIDFGDEWYKQLMSKLESASDVVCLLTERSLDRPWILYEAGVAKGKLDTPVHGVALGISLSKVSTGPFYQFQNSNDDEDSLAKLVLQLCRRVPGIEPDETVVKTQVQAFKENCERILQKLGSSKKQEKKESIDEGAIAKVLEEMKLMVRELPARIESRSVDFPERERPRRFRRFHPMMIEELADRISRRTNDHIGILIISSLVREDFPWLYEIGLETYRTIKSSNGNIDAIEYSLRVFHDAFEVTLRGPFIEEFGLTHKETHMFFRELPMFIDHYMHRLSERPIRRAVRVRNKSSQEAEKK